jgi:hypothetical protein
MVWLYKLAEEDPTLLLEQMKLQVKPLSLVGE